MITFFKGTLASWRSNTATVITLTISATVLAILLSIALGEGDGDSEGKGLASSFSIITGLSAILAARGIQIHSYGLREPLIALLRAVGFSWNRITLLALAESALLATLSFPASLIVGWALAPIIGSYLRSVDLLHPSETAALSAPGAFGSLFTILGISLVCSFAALRSLKKRDKAMSTSAAEKTGTALRIPSIAALALAFLVILVLWGASGFSSSGIGLAFLGTILLFIALPWLLSRGIPEAASLFSRHVGERHVILHSALRCRSASTSVGVTYGVMLCILGGTVFGGHYFVADSAARNSWTSLLGDSKVAVSDGPLPEGTSEHDVTILNQVIGEVVTDRPEDNVWTTPQEGSILFEDRVVDGSIEKDDPGVLITETMADASGIEVGDETLVSVDGSPLDVSAIINLPDTLGSFVVLSNQEPEKVTSTGHKVVIAPEGTAPGSDQESATNDSYISAESWVEQIPDGKVVSNSGGSGVSEAALLMAAPVLLGFTLMVSSRVVANDSQARSYEVLTSLGASRKSRHQLALMESVLEVVLPGALASVIGVAVLLWATRLAISGLGAGPSVMGVIGVPAILLVVLTIVDALFEVSARRRSTAL